jgi:hypothetical protein
MRKVTLSIIDTIDNIADRCGGVWCNVVWSVVWFVVCAVQCGNSEHTYSIRKMATSKTDPKKTKSVFIFGGFFSFPSGYTYMGKNQNLQNQFRFWFSVFGRFLMSTFFVLCRCKSVVWCGVVWCGVSSVWCVAKKYADREDTKNFCTAYPEIKGPKINDSLFLQRGRGRRPVLLDPLLYSP